MQPGEKPFVFPVDRFALTVDYFPLQVESRQQNGARRPQSKFPLPEQGW
jgi:hypothetical protein